MDKHNCTLYEDNRIRIGLRQNIGKFGDKKYIKYFLKIMTIIGGMAV